MPEYIDPTLEALLVDALAERAERVPATLTLERVQARLAERRRPRSRASVRRPLALLGLAAAIVLPLAVLVAGQRPTEPDRAQVDPYQALIERRAGDSWLFVAMRGDGQERVLTSVPIPKPHDDRRLAPRTVSPDGWLATPAATGWEFRNLRAPDQVIGPIAPFLASESGRGWFGDGRYATWNAAGEIQFFDPAAVTVERRSVPGPLTGVVAWTTDASTVVETDDWGRGFIYLSGERRPALWRTMAVGDGFDAVSDDASLSDLDLGWRDGLWWREDGSRVQLCDMAVREECPGLPNGSVVVETPDGELATWYTDELAPDDIVDAVFGDTGLWIMLDRRNEGPQDVLARVIAPGDARPVAAWAGGPPPHGSGSIEGVAPDDSLVVVESHLIDVRTGAVTPVDGQFIGFVPAGTADGWPGDAFQPSRPMASTAPQPLVAYPTLRPLELVLTEQLVPGDRLLWREEHAAVDGAAPAPSTIEIGPIELEEGLGVFLVCSGPSDVLVTMRGPDDRDTDPGPLTPLLSRCLDSDGTAGGYSPEARVDGPVRFLVTATPDTAWQLVVFDPAPPE